MSWLNEFEWCFLVLLIMKWVLLWAVAACLAAADLPCEEYCNCILNGIRNIAYQRNCDCTNRVREFREQLDGSSIYYEPAEYAPMTALIYEHPFYIINPYAAIQKKDFNDINMAITSQQTNPTSRAPSTQIEINIDNMPQSHNRQEKDIQINDKEHAAIYLDIDVEPDNVERSATNNVIAIDDLKLTEETLIECANLHTVLDYRKNKGLKLLRTRNPGPFAKYEYLSDDELIKKINDKCLEISNIVDRSRNEIKGKLPKKTTFRMHDEDYEASGLQLKRSKPKHGIVTSAKAHELAVTSVSVENMTDYDDNNEHTVVIYTDNESDENTTEMRHSLLPTTDLTTLPTPLNEDVISTIIFSSQKAPSQKDSDLSMSTTENSKITFPAATPTYNEIEYAFDTETTSLLTTSPSHINDNISNIDQDLAQNQQSNNAYNDMDAKFESNEQRKEKDDPLVKIITHELNSSVKSYINGTEDTPNREFEDGINNNAINTTEMFKIDAAKVNTDRVGQRMKVDSPDISGHLYFLYNQHHIPAKFVQKPSGALNVGIDGETLCYKLTQDDKRNSPLIKTLCNCYKSGNCITKK